MFVCIPPLHTLPQARASKPLLPRQSCNTPAPQQGPSKAPSPASLGPQHPQQQQQALLAGPQALLLLPRQQHQPTAALAGAGGPLHPLEPPARVPAALK